MKRLSFLFLVLILFSGCSIYKYLPSTLEESINDGAVKIEYKDGSKMKAGQLVIIEDKVYAKKESGYKLLDTSQIENIFIKSKDAKSSQLATVGLVGGIIVGAMVIVTIGIGSVGFPLTISIGLGG